jgi:predicted amidohydrolase YtcJ
MPMPHALRLPLALILSIALASPALAAPKPRPADLILSNAQIYTLDDKHPWAEAIAISGDRIAGVGSAAEIAKWRGPKTEFQDLGGQFVMPGFTDAHLHFLAGGDYLTQVALRDATTMADVRAGVKNYAGQHPDRDWIRGEGWSYGYADMAGGAFQHAMLDDVAPGHPIVLTSSMAHAAWANAEAMKRAGITRDTPNPPNGEVVRDANGEPTGWLKESADQLVLTKIPEATEAEKLTSLRAAIHEANRLGVTRVDSAGDDSPVLPLIARIQREDGRTLRFYVSDILQPPKLDPAQVKSFEALRKTYNDAFIRFGAVKFFMDGVIESHTAYLPEGYADQPGTVGQRDWEPAAYKSAVREMDRRGFQIFTHAIGPGAIDLALDAYQGAAHHAALRHRIEHMEAPYRRDLPRFGKLGVIASMQPLMIYPRDEWKGMEGLWATYAGEQYLPVAFAIRSVLAGGGTAAFGTDWPVVQLNPLLGIRNAVLRQSLDGQPSGGYVPEQRVTVAEAIRAYTLDAAYASHTERTEGSLKPGKLADLIMLSKNLLEIAPNDIPTASVLATYVAGKPVYRAE